MMAVLIVEPHDGYATWLASNALAGLTDRVVRAADPDEAMAAVAAEGRDVLAAVFGPSLSDRDALALAGALQQGTPDVLVLLIRRQESDELYRQAMRVGVKSVLSSASDETAVRTEAARAIEIARTLRGRLGGGAPTDGEGRQPGRVATVFSSKGGCGKTFLSTNLAVALSRGGAEVALVDLDLHFGDVAIMLHLFPSHTIYDAAENPALDALSLKSFLTRHDSGIWTLVAPTEPTIADSINPGAIANILKLLRTAFDYVVIDTPPAFSEPVLAAFDESDWLVMLATLDVPSIKNLRLTLQTMELLHFPKNRIRVVVNRADSKVGLRLPDVEKLLSSPVDATIPSSRSVPLSVNKGSPIMLEEPKGPVADAVRRVAAQLTDAQPGRTKQKQRRSLFARS
jgi:pilus assembly protein CpaE